MSSPTQCASLALFAKQRTTATATGPDHDAEMFIGKGELPHPALVLPSQRREEVDDAVGVAIAREFVRVTKPGKRRKVSGERAEDVFTFASSLTTPPRRKPGLLSPRGTPEQSVSHPESYRNQEEMGDFWRSLLNGSDAHDLPSSPKWTGGRSSKKRRTSDMSDQ